MLFYNANAYSKCLHYSKIFFNFGIVFHKMLRDKSSPFLIGQVINNACATQAILSVLLNAEGLKDSLGSQLTEFRDFTADFPPGIVYIDCALFLQIHKWTIELVS